MRNYPLIFTRTSLAKRVNRTLFIVHLLAILACAERHFGSHERLSKNSLSVLPWSSKFEVKNATLPSELSRSKSNGYPSRDMSLGMLSTVASALFGVTLGPCTVAACAFACSDAKDPKRGFGDLSAFLYQLRRPL